MSPIIKLMKFTIAPRYRTGVQCTLSRDRNFKFYLIPKLGFLFQKYYITLFAIELTKDIVSLTKDNKLTALKTWFRLKLVFKSFWFRHSNLILSTLSTRQYHISLTMNLHIKRKPEVTAAYTLCT